jgi:hypothetical protein
MEMYAFRMTIGVMPSGLALIISSAISLMGAEGAISEATSKFLALEYSASLFLHPPSSKATTNSSDSNFMAYEIFIYVCNLVQISDVKLNAGLILLAAICKSLFQRP